MLKTTGNTGSKAIEIALWMAPAVLLYFIHSNVGAFLAAFTVSYPAIRYSLYRRRNAHS